MPGSRLSLVERAQIEALYGAGWTYPQIADHLGRSRQTVWREVTRNNSGRHGTKSGRPRPARERRAKGYCWGYSARAAEQRARRRARRPKVAKLARAHPNVLRRALVIEFLRRRWSPEQIAGWLRARFPDRPELHVSHETIYQALYLQSRGNLRVQLAYQVALRTGRAHRRHRGRTPSPGAGGRAVARRPWAQGFHLSGRDPQAQDRRVPGHWEGDLIVGARSGSAVITLVERCTRYVLLGALPEGRDSPHVIAVLQTLIAALPDHLRRSLAWDLGTEMATHADFTVATGCPVYFADPHSPWQRGSNENTNGLLRQYLPKSTSLTPYTQTDLDHIATELNTRPRKTLNWQTPAEQLNALLGATTT